MIFLKNMIEKKVVAQCCASIVTDLLALGTGFSTGYTTLLISELYKDDAEIHVSLEELTWISSICFLMTPLGSFISGPLSAPLGRRLLIFLAAFTFVFSWSLFFWACDFWTLLLGFGVLGIAGGIANSAILFYIMEIGEPTMRGFLVAKATGFTSTGVFIHVFLGSYMHFRTLALITLSIPTMTFLLTFLVPESPVWLAGKGRLVELKSSLRWLRGWTSSDDIQCEYKAMLEHLARLKSDSASQPKKSFAKIYLQRRVLAPLRLVIFVFVLDSLNGCSALTNYAVLVFRMLKSPLDNYTATTILAGLQIPAIILLMSLIRRIGKRPPTIISLAVAGLSFFAIAVYVLVMNERESNLSWIPTILIFISMFFMIAGVKNTPWFFAGELFPMEVRSVAVSAAAALYYVFMGLANKSFLYIIDAFSISGTFFLLSAINLVGFVVLYLYMPETEGKTFAEIEEFFIKKKKCSEEGAGSSNTEFNGSSTTQA